MQARYSNAVYLHCLVASVASHALMVAAVIEAGLVSLLQPLTDEVLVAENLETAKWIPFAFMAVFVLRGISGYATEALNLITKYIFEELSFHRIYAFFHEKNSAVAKVMEKCGYEKEGVSKDSLYDGSEYYDDIIYAKVKN